MQLFTLGLYQFNMDGSVKMSGSTPLETYGLADVSGLARFTGLSLATSDNTTPITCVSRWPSTPRSTKPAAPASSAPPCPGGGTAAIKSALDTIFAHAIVPPFVSTQLIQRLVTSNPSAAYVARVSAVFADNGKGVRGDMQAVIRAILLDIEARSDSILTAQASGKLREPVMRLTAERGRTASPRRRWHGRSATRRARPRGWGQAMGRSQSVFNWLRPGSSPPDTSIASAGLVAPEFQITNEQTVVAYISYMQTLVASGTGDVKADYTDILTKASDNGALVDEVNLVLAAGQLSATTVASIKTAMESIAATATSGPANRVYTTILLTLASPDYLTVK